MKKLFEGILRFVVGVFAFFAPVVIIVCFCAAFSAGRYRDLFLAAILLYLDYKATQWLDWF